MKTNFTYESYRELLEAFLARGYRVCGFEEAVPGARHLIVRHDIDMSLKLAEPIAEIEADLGISAVYFVLVRCEFYNPLSKASRHSLEKIQSYGHEIGLHFDAACHSNTVESLDGCVDEECHILELVTGKPIRVISFHRPISELQGLVGPLAGRRHAYEPPFFTEMGYCSDSRGAWHYGHPLEQEAVLQGRAMQLLTHPIWWTENLIDGPLPKLECFLGERRHLLEAELAENCEPYRAGFEDRKD